MTSMNRNSKGLVNGLLEVRREGLEDELQQLPLEPDTLLHLPLTFHATLKKRGESLRPEVPRLPSGSLCRSP